MTNGDVSLPLDSKSFDPEESSANDSTESAETKALPADFVGFDPEPLRESLPADFAGFDQVPSGILGRLDPESRARVEELAKRFGFTVTHLIRQGQRDPELPLGAPEFPNGTGYDFDAWRNEHLFAAEAIARARANEGKSVWELEQEAIAKEKAEASQEEWWIRQEHIQHGWTLFMRKWRKDRVAAEALRQQHTGGDPEREAEWLISLCPPKWKSKTEQNILKRKGSRKRGKKEGRQRDLP